MSNDVVELRGEWQARQARIEEQVALEEWRKADEEPDKQEVERLYGEALYRGLAKRKAMYVWLKHYRLELGRREQRGKLQWLLSQFGDDDLI